MKKFLQNAKQTSFLFMWLVLVAILTVQFLLPSEKISENMFMVDGIIILWILDAVRRTFINGSES